MPRFFVDQPLEGQVFLGGEDGRHLAKSLRVRPGEEVTLCDGRGRRRAVQGAVHPGGGGAAAGGKNQPQPGGAQTKVTVCQCLCKGDKLETVTQKAVELGAVEIWPLESARCVVKVDGKSAPKKVARLQKIAREAAMQSGRGVIPQVLAPASLKQALEEAARQGEILFFYERGGGRGGGEPAPGLAGRRGRGSLCLWGRRRLRPRGGGAGPVFGGQAADLGAPHPAHGDSAPWRLCPPSSMKRATWSEGGRPHENRAGDGGLGWHRLRRGPGAGPPRLERGPALPQQPGRRPPGGAGHPGPGGHGQNLPGGPDPRGPGGGPLRRGRGGLRLCRGVGQQRRHSLEGGCSPT